MLILINALYLQANESIMESPVFSGSQFCTPFSICWCSGPGPLRPVVRRVVAVELRIGGAQGLCVLVWEVAEGQGMASSGAVRGWRLGEE